MGYNLKLLSKNFNGLNSSKTQIKTFKYLGKISQIMEYYSYRKLILLMTLSSIGVTILGVNCFFHMEP